MSQDALTKICRACGQRKPLSAFLQMNKAGTASHGQICATCRKTEAEAAARLRKTEAEGSGTQETGHKIDGKARMQGEKDKREHSLAVDENYHEDRALDATDAKSSQQKTALKQQTEKKIRDTIFSKRPVGETKQTPTTTPAEKMQAEQFQANEERQKTEVDYTGPVLPPKIAGQSRFHSIGFQALLTRLGKDSPLTRAAGNAVKRAGTEKIDPKETLAEHIENTFGPKGRR